MHSGLNDAQVSLQEGDSYVILRCKEGNSDKYYGLLNENGVTKTNWGRFNGHVLPTSGQQKECSRRELLDLLNAKIRKGYKVLEIRRCMSNMTAPRPEGLDGAYMLMPKNQEDPNAKVWGLYDTWNNFMMWVPKEVASSLVRDFGLVITGLNRF